MSSNNPAQINTTQPMRIALVVGLVAAILAVVGLFVNGAETFFQAYLLGYLFILGISLGSLAILLLHFVVSSRWGVTIRRINEAAAGNIVVVAVFFIPLLFGLSYVFPWARPGTFENTPALQFKALYLSVPFFIARAVVYFIIWGLLAFFANRSAARMDSDQANLALVGRLQGQGAISLILYLVTMTLASVDWLMSLQPFWNSTVFGLVTVLGQTMTAMSFALVLLNVFPSLSLGRSWTHLTTPVPYKDLGALLLTMVLSWAYVAYFQMLIMWAGNIPEEVTWYVARVKGGWDIIAIFVVLFQFALPFAIMISIRARHNLKRLAWLGGLLLLTNLINLFWQIKPAFFPGQLTLSWLDLVLPVALGGLWFAGFLYMLQRRPALTIADSAILSGDEHSAHTSHAES